VTEERWTTAECARYLGITPATWRHYYARHQPKFNPAPPPDGRYDRRTPWWWPETVMAWHASRTGTGRWPRTAREQTSS
jgi:hypothetical protein